MRGTAALLVTAGLVYAAGAVCAVSGDAPAEARREAPSKRAGKTPPRDTAGDRVLGFAISLHHTTEIDRFHRAVDRIADLGLNTVEILTPAYQTHANSENVRIETGPGRGPRREQLVSVLEHARRRGLRTVLMPIVLFTDPRGNEWRGKIQPPSWDAWWKSYREAMGYFLGVANETDTAVFSVGSELLSTETQTRRWRRLIGDVRDRFDGKLMYSTNWDHYEVPGFWKDLDWIGVNAYWDVAEGTDPQDPELSVVVENWRRIRRRLLAFAERRDRPVLITELGYPTLPWGLEDPWNYVPTESASPAPAIQATGYKAFLRAWAPLLKGAEPAPHWAGMCFYEWDVYHRGGPEDTGYGVRGKPALGVLERWLEKAR